MQAYQGYVENGRIIPFGNPFLPDGQSVIITVLDQNVSSSTRADRRLQALHDFEAGLQTCEPLPPEFDGILRQRVNIDRACDL